MYASVYRTALANTNDVVSQQRPTDRETGRCTVTATKGKLPVEHTITGLHTRNTGLSGTYIGLPVAFSIARLATSVRGRFGQNTATKRRNCNADRNMQCARTAEIRKSDVSLIKP